MAVSDDLDCIARQEQTLLLPRLDADFAWRLGTALRERALARGAAVAIEVRRGVQLLFHAALDGATPDNTDWLRRKGNVVARFERSSYAIGLRLAAQGTDLATKYGLPLADYAAHGGAFPLRLAGTGMVGWAAVSGLPQRADHELVVETLCAELGVDPATLALPAVAG
jgi:uncharacterized protein (UPF0303 family)